MNGSLGFLASFTRLSYTTELNRGVYEALLWSSTVFMFFAARDVMCRDENQMVVRRYTGIPSWYQSLWENAMLKVRRYKVNGAIWWTSLEIVKATTDLFRLPLEIQWWKLKCGETIPMSMSWLTSKKSVWTLCLPTSHMADDLTSVLSPTPNPPILISGRYVKPRDPHQSIPGPSFVIPTWSSRFFWVS